MAEGERTPEAGRVAVNRPSAEAQREADDRAQARHALHRADLAVRGAVLSRNVTAEDLYDALMGWMAAVELAMLEGELDPAAKGPEVTWYLAVATGMHRWVWRRPWLYPPSEAAPPSPPPPPPAPVRARPRRRPRPRPLPDEWRRIPAPWRAAVRPRCVDPVYVWLVAGVFWLLRDPGPLRDREVTAGAVLAYLTKQRPGLANSADGNRIHWRFPAIRKRTGLPGLKWEHAVQDGEALYQYSLQREGELESTSDER